MCADCHLPGTLCMWTDCTTCFESCASAAGECGCLGGAGEAGLSLLFVMALIVLGLFTVIGIFYSVLAATMVGQRIWQRHYHILAKRMLTKEYVVEDVDGELTGCDWNTLLLSTEQIPSNDWAPHVPCATSVVLNSFKSVLFAPCRLLPNLVSVQMEHGTNHFVIVVVEIWVSNQQSILLGLLGTRPRMLKGRSAQTNRSKRPGRGRSKLLRRGNQTKAMTTDGIMGRVHGSQRDPRKDKRESRDGRKDRNPVEIDQVEIDQAKYSTSPKGEGEIALWLRASSIEIAWRGPMLNIGLVLPRSRGFGDSVWHSNAEMGLHRTDVWRCPLSPLGRGVILGSSLAVRSRDFAESALNQKAVAESAEMEMVRAQNRAIELEGALAEEKAKGKKRAQDADARDKVIARLEARISELERSQSLTQGRIIAAFKESDDFLEAYPDLGVDLEDVEMDHELLAKEEAEAEKRAAEEGATRCCSVFELHLAVNRSTAPFMSSKTILGNEESEQSLPSWISDHLGGRSYIDETNQSPSLPPVLTNSPKMDTSSLNKESNVMSQAELDNLGATYSFPPGVRLRIPGDGETILSARQGELSPNAWRSVICSLVIWRHFKRHMSCDEFRCLYSLSPLPDSGWYYFKARPEKNLLRGSPSNVKGWKTRFFFASGDEWEFPSGTAASDSIPRVSRSWGTLGKSCNKLPTLSEVDAKRTETVFGKIEPGGYFEVSKVLVLGSRTFRKHFAVGCTALSTSGRDNTTSGDDGERALPGIPDETLLRWLGGKVKDPFTNLLSGKSGSSSDSGSDYISDSELPPELRSDAISARVGAPALGEKIGGKAKAEKAVKATTAKPPTKGVVIREKRTREGDHVIEIGEPDSSKGKEAAPPPPPKRFKSTRGAINARGRTVEAGTSTPGGDIGSESMMSDASVARRLLTGVIPASDKKEIDGLSENELVAKSFHALGQVVMFASSLALRSQEHLHDIDFHMARADSAELELVKAQKRAVRLAELSEEGSKPGTEVDDLKATVAELTNKLAKAKELAIEDFKASGEFKAAVTDSAATYFSEGFEFCKRQLLHQFPNLGVDVANMAMDPNFAEEEEAMKEGEDPVAGVAPDV
ncbi:RING/FYVE/PHD zinc finger superfamily protein [Actinidia rufa]|uniref:RING/FYVE/PHD zinc finger superfamily protein n=1 Tax=Actinidia rufa TaxID=165716 RepID=A0A7J0H9Y5_9ERIC|nr:RING/FYVE/PHD zinc finger superfamily protein [Actinidia rufa]